MLSTNIVTICDYVSLTLRKPRMPTRNVSIPYNSRHFFYLYCGVPAFEYCTHLALQSLVQNCKGFGGKGVTAVYLNFLEGL